MTTAPEISVILPGYNEAANIEPMVAQVRAALAGTGRTWEMLWVDDGSTDGSRTALERAAMAVPQLWAIFHSRNYGQSAALLTGFQAAQGRLIATLDSDLQNDPADLPAMIAQLEQGGWDAVCGVRQQRKDTRKKRFSSWIANKVRGGVMRDKVTDAGCTLRVMRRETLQHLPAFRALHRFLPTILHIHGFRILEVPVRHRARIAGVSKYGVGGRLGVGLLDLPAMCWYRLRYIPVNRVAR